MARISLSTGSQQRELKSVNEGWVEVRPLSFGEAQKRREISVATSMQQDVGPQRRTSPNRNKNKQPETARLDIQTLSHNASVYTFSTCIVNHNLEDENGNRIDFRDSKTIDRLPKVVGEEIEAILDEINEDVNEDDLADFEKQLRESSEVTT